MKKSEKVRQLVNTGNFKAGTVKQMICKVCTVVDIACVARFISAAGIKRLRAYQRPKSLRGNPVLVGAAGITYNRAHENWVVPGHLTSSTLMPIGALEYGLIQAGLVLGTLTMAVPSLAA